MKKEAPTPNPGVLSPEPNPEQLQIPPVEMAQGFTIRKSEVSLSEFGEMAELLRNKFEAADVGESVLEYIKGLMFNYIYRLEWSFEYGIGADWPHMLRLIQLNLRDCFDNSDSQQIVISILDDVVAEFEFNLAASTAVERGVKNETV